LAGEKIRTIARSTGLDRNTIWRIVGSATRWESSAIHRGPRKTSWKATRQRIGRRGATVADGQTEQQLKPGTDQIRAWLDKDHLLLTKVHELLGREGLVAVPDRSDLTEVEFGSEWFSPGHFPDCSLFAN